MDALEERLRYKFRDRRLLMTALTHSSYANENRRKSYESNERLEFLGDSVLGFVVAEALYKREREMPEGSMTRARAQLVCEENLHRVAMELKLGDYIRLGIGEERSGGRLRASILADCVEAIIAAMYLDGGLAPAKELIERHFLVLLDTGDWLTSNDPKTELQELVQRKSGQALSYELVCESGPEHNKHFFTRVLLNGEKIGSGEGKTKKDSEQAAARAAIRELTK